MRLSLVIARLTLALSAVFSPPAVGVALAQSVPDYGLQWVTIGDPGNRGVLPSEVPSRPSMAAENVGAVSYEFRMSRTELTTRQWYEFVLAYAPYYDGVGFSDSFTGSNIEEFGGSYVLLGNADQPTVMSWEYAARYANWLHNDKAPTREAFESGAYDTSTFTTNPDGTDNHQLTRSPGAKFWIPSRSEWIKATYWDPSKNNGDGGYWRHPGGSDTLLVSGPPEVGGQTNAGTVGNRPANVGSYPGVSAPWGLLDTSGGLPEWTEQVRNPNFPLSRELRGSTRGQPMFQLVDPIDGVSGATGTGNPSAGFRIAGIIPAPHSAAGLGLFLIMTASRRRPCSHGGVVCSRASRRSGWQQSPTGR